MGRLRRGTALVAVGLGLLACSGDETDHEGDAARSEQVAEPEVRDELLAMMEDDQTERTEGTGSASTDRERTERLQAIVEEHGWPTLSMVGKEGATAAWLIAQHSDFDVELQEELLALMQAEGDDVDASEVAYLEDRVAVNNGEPQRYGTQVSCVPEGGVEPSTPLVDEAAVDALREEAGMEPLADYYTEFEEGCAADPGVQ